MVRVFKPGLSDAQLKAAVDDSVRRTRLFPPALGLFLRLAGHNPESVAGFAPGFQRLPHVLIPGAMSIKGVKAYNHEWLHHYWETSKNHYALSDAFTGYAGQWGEWQKGQMYRKPVIKGGRLHYFKRPEEGKTALPQRITYDLAGIEARFKQEDPKDHNAWSPAMSLGELANLEESRLKLPGYGFFLMREVANGMPVRKALAFVAKSPTIERERKTLLQAHPDLNWIKK